MKRVLLAMAFAAGALSVSPASAAIVVDGAGQNGTGIPSAAFTNVNGTAAGTFLDGWSGNELTATYSANLRTAVFRNASGTLDFFYQVARLGDGSMGPMDSSFIDRLTAFNFAGYSVDALVRTDNFDGTGNTGATGSVNFTNAANPANPGGPGGFTTRATRSTSGGTVRAEFGANSLAATDISATYIFRTNATQFRPGTFQTINGSTAEADFAFAPAGPAVPEPATWLSMLIGFGAIGSFMRRGSKGVRVSFA